MPDSMLASVPRAADIRSNGRRGPTPKAPRFDVAARLKKRTWPACATVLLFCVAMAYFFFWGPTVQHAPIWETPGDLWDTYAAANALVHGHFGAIYAPINAFYAFPGILIVLAPVVVLTTGLGMSADVFPNQGFLHPQALLLLGPYVVLLSVFALFACDALAERLGVDWRRRGVLALAEGVVLFNISVSWGHPEDAVAVGFAIYSLIAALDGRFPRAGWLLGAAVAFQPLVVVALPILLVIGGRKQALGFIVRGAIPGVVLAIAPLVSDAQVTLHSQLDQPFTYPRIFTNHATPWTFLAPKLGGSGINATFGGGPIRTVSLLLACAVGLWALRWRNRPEMLMWAFALALALRCYTESVMTDYYLWPALALALVVAARCSNARFVIAIVAAVATTVTAQWHYTWLAWWLLDMGGITVVLAAAARPSPIPAATAAQSPLSDRHAAQLRDRSTSTGRAKREAAEARRRKNKSARAARSRTRRT
jgi:hypothetical protein